MLTLCLYSPFVRILLFYGRPPSDSKSIYSTQGIYLVRLELFHGDRIVRIEFSKFEGIDDDSASHLLN